MAGALAAAVHILIGQLCYLYGGRYRTGSFEEVQAVSLTVVVSAAAVLAVDLGLPSRPVPASAAKSIAG